jgi:hypothetical protein
MQRELAATRRRLREEIDGLASRANIVPVRSLPRFPWETTQTAPRSKSDYEMRKS